MSQLMQGPLRGQGCTQTTALLSSDRSCAQTGQTAGQTAGQPCVLLASIAGVGAPSP